MPVVIRSNRPAEIQAFVARNSPNSLRSTAGDSWKAYLQDQGATGGTFYDLEQSNLRNKGFLNWNTYIDNLGYALRTIRESLRSWLAGYTYVPPGGGGFLLMEDGLSHFLLEDGTGAITLE